MTSPPAFLVRHLPRHEAHSSGRPFITLTWAQSLDAKIAGPGGARVTISCPETFVMTHWMRTMHDAILIGINTLIMDDPRLKIQLVPQDDPTLLPPQPLILDPQLRFPVRARILSEWNNHKTDPSQVVRQPWILCGNGVDHERIRQVEDAGARVVSVELDTNGRIPPASVPAILTSLGLRSVMIEGGSRILSSFLHAPPGADGSPLVDCVVVTVAPMFIADGIGVVPPDESTRLPQLKAVHTEAMGRDAVMVCEIHTPNI